MRCDAQASHLSFISPWQALWNGKQGIVDRNQVCLKLIQHRDGRGEAGLQVCICLICFILHVRHDIAVIFIDQFGQCIQSLDHPGYRQARAGRIISDAIRLCGGENVFGHLSQMSPTVSVEAVLEANPEAIVATGMGDARPEWLNDWNKWARMTAVKRGNLFHINPDILQRHTPRILDGAEQLCADLDIARSRRPAGDRQK